MAPRSCLHLAAQSGLSVASSLSCSSVVVTCKGGLSALRLSLSTLCTLTHLTLHLVFLVACPLKSLRTSRSMPFTALQQPTELVVWRSFSSADFLPLVGLPFEPCGCGLTEHADRELRRLHVSGRRWYFGRTMGLRSNAQSPQLFPFLVALRASRLVRQWAFNVSPRSPKRSLTTLTLPWYSSSWCIGSQHREAGDFMGSRGGTQSRRDL